MIDSQIVKLNRVIEHKKQTQNKIKRLDEQGKQLASLVKEREHRMLRRVDQQSKQFGSQRKIKTSQR